MQFIDLKAQQKLIRNDVEERIRNLLDHGQYILGPEVKEMEQALADYVGVKHCISVASGTDALLVALMALGIGHGDEVITAPFSFIATAEVIALLGATPVFVDIDPKTYNLDTERIEAAISDRTRAVMPVSIFGQCADMTAINAVAGKHGLPVIEDAAQSFGAEQTARKSCGLSTIGCTSFFPAKPLGCYGDGGACFTDDDELAARMRELRNHGQDRRYHHPRVGINGRMDTMQAAIVLSKMTLFPDEVSSRSNLGARYSEMLADADCTTPYIAPQNLSVYAQYTLRVSDRDALAAKLREAGIPTAVHYPVTLDQQPALADCCRAAGSLEIARNLAREVISLPMHPYLSGDDLEQITEAVKAALKS